MQQQRVKNINDALNVLVQGVGIAQKRGVYSFEESHLIFESINFIKTLQQQQMKQKQQMNTIKEDEVLEI
jgi:hypothetical protein